MALRKPNLAHHSCFEIGAEVEVTSADHSLRGTLFPAKIIARLCKTNKVVVEYKSLEATDVPLRESVDIVLLRPLPPPEKDHSFDFGDEVDAFFSGGWWEGVITQVAQGPAYWVYFRFAKQEFHFQPSELRRHREWVNGTWLPPRVRIFFLMIFCFWVFIFKRKIALFSTFRRIWKIVEGKPHNNIF